MAAKALVLDANILLRAVLGRRVREIIEAHAGTVSFLVPEAAFAEAEEHLQTLVVRRGGNPERARAAFVRLSALLELVVCEACAEFEEAAIRTIARCWRSLSHSHVRYGPKIPTSLAAASLPGHRIAC